MGGDGRTYAKSRFGPSLCCNGYRKGENNGWEVREDGRGGKDTRGRKGYKGKERVQREGKGRDTKGREGYKGKGRGTKGRGCLEEGWEGRKGRKGVQREGKGTKGRKGIQREGSV